ncbi:MULTISPECIES: redoxin domain-containing protein [Ralstonia]|jgi:peroxiredoxin|uniref:Thioredoxin domain-containing protein n=2 Tax=Ralstonia TaxID=48736 RepID=A0AAD2BY03_9RALS|nr:MULTISPECIES: redoxin domain-containing protein [Ralstonia]MCK8653284.1 peroxiredoxin family protein [Ralstonia insidiosa]CAJ0804018.1 hypothetical protein R77560_04004 [Ralstonia sp. LMG 18095]
MRQVRGKAIQGRGRGLARLPRAFLVAVIGMLVLSAIVWWSYPNKRQAILDGAQPTPASASSGRYPFQTGDPGPGTLAPPIQLRGVGGRDFDLRRLRGTTVLLYFQEGVTCQSCWDQDRDIARHFSEFRALGIDTIVTITTDPIDLLKKKASDTDIVTPVLSDPDLAVSRAYHANDYGMMGTRRDGHTFIVVGPDGRIQWRADYGGAPAYTMYVPVDVLVADLRRGLHRDK